MVDFSALFRVEVIGFKLAALFASEKWPSCVVDSDDGATKDAAAAVEPALLSSW
jgi:hypothetical protein